MTHTITALYAVSIVLGSSFVGGSTISIFQPDFTAMTDLPPSGFGQSFTANGNYSIVAIDLYVSASSGGSDATLGIYTFNSSLLILGTTALGTGTFLETEINRSPSWVRVHFSSPIPVNDGDEFAFTIVARDLAGGATGWNNYGYNRLDVYAGGRHLPLSMTQQTSDLAFAVVTVPEPSSLFLFSFGLLYATSRRTIKGVAKSERSGDFDCTHG